MAAVVVVVLAVFVEEALQVGQGGRRGAGAEPVLEGLVVALTFAAGLWVIGAGVNESAAPAGDGAGKAGLGRGAVAGMRN